MDTESVTQFADLSDSLTKEYSLVIDGVIEIKAGVEAKSFFDGLLDVVVAYVEQHEGMAGLGMSYKV